MLVALGVGSEAQDSKRMERTITVSATGTAKVQPDIARISAGLVTEAATAREAIDRNKAGMSKFIDGMKAAAIEARDIQTTVFNVEPRYTQPKDGRPGTINGYRVVNHVRLTVRNVGRLGEVLDQAIALGANQINQIAFDLAEPEQAQDEARKQAIAKARRRAELYAAAAGVTLGPVLRIAEGEGPSAPDGRVMMRAAVPIEPGTRTLEIEVHVTYELR
jgi:uncharacterized protein YggE